MRRSRPDITKYDFTFPCAHCGYKIPPSELLRVDGEHVKCPKCGQLADAQERVESQFGAGVEILSSAAESNDLGYLR